MTWSTNCVIVSTVTAIEGTIFAVLHTKLYVPAVILSTKNNGKLLDQLKLDFKWNKYQLL